jgi:hypothetical protein
LPKDPNAEDDGLLTASEVAQLRLNADWVVLSACNTAAGETPGAEALSGGERSPSWARERRASAPETGHPGPKVVGHLAPGKSIS